MTATLFAIAGALFLFFLYLQHLSDVRATRYAKKQQRLAEERKNTLSDVLSSAHHQMSRELAMLELDIDDLTTAGGNTAGALDSVGRLVESRDSIAVLAQLGQDEKWLEPTMLVAEDIAPENNALIVAMETGTPLSADRPLLKVAVTSITRHLERYGFTHVRLAVDHHTLRMTASRPLTSPQMDHGDAGMDRLAERVLNAHGAEFELTEEPLEWCLIATFPVDIAGAIDVRAPSRQAITKRGSSAERVHT